MLFHRNRHLVEDPQLAAPSQPALLVPLILLFIALAPASLHSMLITVGVSPASAAVYMSAPLLRTAICGVAVLVTGIVAADLQRSVAKANMATLPILVSKFEMYQHRGGIL